MPDNRGLDLVHVSDADVQHGAAVIVAAGSGKRMGFDKTLTPVAGEPLICHAVRAFDLCRNISEIVVVTAPEREESMADVLKNFSKPVRVVRGGETRQDSVLAGLSAVSDSCALVAIHDAARPLVTPDFISRCFAAAREFGGSVAAERLTDTLQQEDADGFCDSPVPREGLWRMQTPQVFSRVLLLAAAEDAAASGVVLTDETSVMRRAGHPVYLVENPDWNIKVTLPRDVGVVDFLLRARAAESMS